MKKILLPKLSLRSLRVIIACALFASLTFTGGYYVGKNGLKPQIDSSGNVTIERSVPPEFQNVDFSLFWSIWDTLETDYLFKDKLNKRDMVFGAIEGMVSAAGDPYTVFLPPEENRVFEEDISGSFEGVGIQIGFKGSRLAVVAPLPGTPAEEAGVQAGDLIVGIRDENKGVDRDTVGITLQEAVQTIRGPEGSTVTLVLVRGDNEEPIVVDIVRESIDVPSVLLTFEEAGEILGEDSNAQGKYAHLRLLKFGGETESEWNTAMRDILSEPNVQGVVLDVRNNPGGYLQAAVDVAGDFLESGSVVVIEEGSQGQRQEFKTEGIPRLTNIPTIILINQGSASASEILSGALRDHEQLTLVGTTTFGKGTIQEPRQLSNGSSLHITTARWLTPSGKWIDEGGLTPDIEIEDDPETPEDEQLQEAITTISER